MYNTDFLRQIEKSRRHIFGTGCFDCRSFSEEVSRKYFPPVNLKVIECYEDINGEYVPIPVQFSKIGQCKFEKKSKNSD